MFIWNSYGNKLKSCDHLSCNAFSQRMLQNSSFIKTTFGITKEWPYWLNKFPSNITYILINHFNPSSSISLTSSPQVSLTWTSSLDPQSIAGNHCGSCSCSYPSLKLACSSRYRSFWSLSLRVRDFRRFERWEWRRVLLRCGWSKVLQACFMILLCWTSWRSCDRTLALAQEAQQRDMKMPWKVRSLSQAR